MIKSSVEIRLLHDVHKVFKGDLLSLVPVVAVSNFEHQAQTFITDVFLELGSDLCQVLEGDRCVVVVIIHLEGFLEFLFWLPLDNEARHECFKLILIDLTGAILVRLLHQLFDFLLVVDESEGPHGILQLLSVDETRVILVEQLKRFLDFYNLLRGQLYSLLDNSLDDFLHPAVSSLLKANDLVSWLQLVSFLLLLWLLSSLMGNSLVVFDILERLAVSVVDHRPDRVRGVSTSVVSLLRREDLPGWLKCWRQRVPYRHRLHVVGACVLRRLDMILAEVVIEFLVFWATADLLIQLDLQGDFLVRGHAKVSGWATRVLL